MLVLRGGLFIGAVQKVAKMSTDTKLVTAKSDICGSRNGKKREDNKQMWEIKALSRAK
jgi:hypothetical protein